MMNKVTLVLLMIAALLWPFLVASVVLFFVVYGFEVSTTKFIIASLVCLFGLPIIAYCLYHLLPEEWSDWSKTILMITATVIIAIIQIIAAAKFLVYGMRYWGYAPA